MNSDQPEASSSVSPRRTHHLGTFVFDGNLPREDYLRLIEPDGPVHKLVQRLMEKHGGEENVRLSILITSTSSPETLRDEGPFRQDYGTPSFFLTSLPKLARRFAVKGAGDTIDIPWPRFSDGGLSVQPDHEDGHRRSTLDEERLMQGVVGALESFNRSAFALRSPPPQSWLRLVPPSAQPALHHLYSPPLVPPSSSSLQQRYLIMIASASSTSLVASPSSAVVSGWNSCWDGAGWDKLVEGCKEINVNCSCLIIVPPGTSELAVARMRLKNLCQATTDDRWDDLWFPTPPDMEIHLNGFLIDETVPSLGNGQSSTVGSTEHLVTPASTGAMDIPTPAGSADQNKQALMHQQALRLLQAQAARAGGDASAGKPSFNPAVIQNIVTAAKNGQIDLNNPALQQFKHLIMLQQQQRLGQASMNPGAAAAANVNGIQGVYGANVEQMIQAAVNAQSLVQQQPGYGQGHNGAGVGNNSTNPPAQPPQTSKQSQKMWTGDLVWVLPHGGVNTELRFTIDTFPFNQMSPQDYQLQFWPSELKVALTRQMNVADLQQYTRQHETPIIVFSPSQSLAADPANANRYQALVNSLHAKGNMSVVPMMGQLDRGILLFATGGAAQPNGERVNSRLMGVLCLNAPLPMTVRSNTQIQQNIPQQQQQAQQNDPPPIPSMPISALPQAQQFAQNAFTQQHLSGQQPSVNGSVSYPQSAQPQLNQPHFQQPLSGQQPQAQLLQYTQAQQRQPNLQQQQQPNQMQFQGQAQQGMPPTQPGQTGYVNPKSVQIIREMARNYGVNLPPNFDPNAVGPEKLQAVLAVIRQAETLRKQQQQQQQQQQLQQGGVNLSQIQGANPMMQIGNMMGTNAMQMGGGAGGPGGGYNGMGMGIPQGQGQYMQQ